ncbi:hypothetical protein [Methanopyrus sp.]
MRPRSTTITNRHSRIALTAIGARNPAVRTLTPERFQRQFTVSSALATPGRR